MKIKKFVIYEEKKFSMDKKYYKVRDHYHYTEQNRGAAHSICNLRSQIPKEISVVFHNGSTYGYHFIIRQIAKEFEGNFECLGENTEKYIAISGPIKKEHDNGKITIYKLKFIDSYKSMQNSLSNLFNNLFEVNDKIIVSESDKKISQEILIKIF